MAKITKVQAREILDSRGYPTIEVDVTVDQKIIGRAAIPSGASTGAHEAIELRDGNKNRYQGKGVLTAVENVNKILGPKVIGMDVREQEKLDELLLQIDSTENKKKYGANAILGVSLAALKAAALSEGQMLYRWVGGDKAVQLPVPLMNVLNGGAHADNGLDIQEFMIAPVCGGRFSEALRAGSEIFHTLKKVLIEKNLATAVGDEGGFAPKLKNNEEALSLLAMAVDKSGYKLGQDIYLALDVASTEFFNDGTYNWENKKISGEELGEIYNSWRKKYPIISIEDGFAEDDWSSWQKFTKKSGKELQIVGDDLFVTNPKRLARGIEEHAANSILVKVNQIGSFTETKRAVEMAHSAGFHTVMSHRSGETEDVTIADLSVGLNCEQIKTGSLCRAERTAKYNQLLRIEESLGTKVQYRGIAAFAFS
ncbi:MAG: phosphopyruvate hydratase [Bdellovibrionales bacterium]